MSDSMTKFHSTCVLIFSTVSNELKHIFHKGQDTTLNNIGFLFISACSNTEKMQKSRQWIKYSICAIFLSEYKICAE